MGGTQTLASYGEILWSSFTLFDQVVCLPSILISLLFHCQLSDRPQWSSVDLHLYEYWPNQCDPRNLWCHQSGGPPQAEEVNCSVQLQRIPVFFWKFFQRLHNGGSGVTCDKSSWYQAHRYFKDDNSDIFYTHEIYIFINMDLSAHLLNKFFTFSFVAAEYADFTWFNIWKFGQTLGYNLVN